MGVGGVRGLVVLVGRGSGGGVEAGGLWCWWVAVVGVGGGRGLVVLVGGGSGGGMEAGGL